MVPYIRVIGTVITIDIDLFRTGEVPGMVAIIAINRLSAVVVILLYICVVFVVHTDGETQTKLLSRIMFVDYV